VHDLGGRDGMGPVRGASRTSPCTTRRGRAECRAWRSRRWVLRGPGRPPSVTPSSACTRTLFRGVVLRAMAHVGGDAPRRARRRHPGRAGCRARGRVRAGGAAAGAAPSRAGTGPHGSAFTLGDRVRVRNRHPLGHTTLSRLRPRSRRRDRALRRPRATSTTWKLTRMASAWNLCIACAFEGRELWGDDAESSTSVCVDLFETISSPHERAPQRSESAAPEIQPDLSLTATIEDGGPVSDAHTAHMTPVAERVAALERVLKAKGLVDRRGHRQQSSRCSARWDR